MSSRTTSAKRRKNVGNWWRGLVSNRLPLIPRTLTGVSDVQPLYLHIWRGSAGRTSSYMAVGFPDGVVKKAKSFQKNEFDTVHLHLNVVTTSRNRNDLTAPAIFEGARGSRRASHSCSLRSLAYGRLGRGSGAITAATLGKVDGSGGAVRVFIERILDSNRIGVDVTCVGG